jgi:hypothetical protein
MNRPPFAAMEEVGLLVGADNITSLTGLEAGDKNSLFLQPRGIATFEDYPCLG